MPTHFQNGSERPVKLCFLKLTTGSSQPYGPGGHLHTKIWEQTTKVTNFVYSLFVFKEMLYKLDLPTQFREAWDASEQDDTSFIDFSAINENHQLIKIKIVIL